MPRIGLCGVVLAALAISAAQGESRLPADFVYLHDVDPSIRQDMRYAGGNNFVGHPLPGYAAGECVLKAPVAAALKRVQADLAARDLTLKVYDCYRPARAVAAMARWARGDSGPDTRRFYPALDKNRLFALGYIASHSAHSRGVAVDLTIIPRQAAPAAAYDPNARYGSCAGLAAARAPDDSLDMGTGFDCFDPKSHTRDPGISAEEKSRRQILLEAMARRGFANYRREWWHFSYSAADTRTEYDFTIAPR